MPRKETRVPNMKTIKYISYVALFALLVGCATTFRPWEFSKVEEGMDRVQVEKILGDPSRVESKDGAELLYYSYNQDYDPSSASGTQGGIQATQAKRSMKTQNYVVKMVDGKVQSTKELPSTSTL